LKVSVLNVLVSNFQISEYLNRPGITLSRGPGVPGGSDMLNRDEFFGVMEVVTGVTEVVTGVTEVAVIFFEAAVGVTAAALFFGVAIFTE
jgi:hypothetical protein